MKSLKIAKMNIRNMLKSIKVFYLIIISITVFLVIINKFENADITQSGIEMVSIIFLFVCGLNSFKENYYFAKASNISRRTFISGILISVLPITALMSIIDIIINRITNIFLQSPTLYDMSFGNLRLVQRSGVEWIQSNSINDLLLTFIFELVICIAAYILGLVITMIYYRCNKLMKVIVSVSPLLVTIVLNYIVAINSDIINSISRVFNFIFGEKLIQKLEAKYRKCFYPIYQVDSALLGGIRIEMEDKVIDGSILKRLQSLKEVMKL